MSLEQVLRHPWIVENAKATNPFHDLINVPIVSAFCWAPILEGTRVLSLQTPWKARESFAVAGGLQSAAIPAGTNVVSQRHVVIPGNKSDACNNDLFD